jgi:4-amino-4-deoxy-L-arabinose transferase-like glycosyltransferase
MGMGVAVSGLGLALIALFAGLGGPLWGKTLNFWDIRKVCAAGLLIEAFGIFFIGPAEPLPTSFGFMFPGMALLGVGVAAVQVVTLRTLNFYVTEDVI